MGGLLHLVQRGGPGRTAAPSSPILAVPNVTRQRPMYHVALLSVPKG